MRVFKLPKTAKFTMKEGKEGRKEGRKEEKKEGRKERGREGGRAGGKEGGKRRKYIYKKKSLSIKIAQDTWTESSP